MVNAVIQIVLQLLTDALLGVADAGEMGNGSALAVLLDLVQNLQVLAHVGAACAVGAGDVVGIQGIQLLKNAVFTAELLHADIGLGGKHLKRKRSSLAEDVLNAHSYLLSILQNNIYLIPAPGYRYKHSRRGPRLCPAEKETLFRSR